MKNMRAIAMLAAMLLLLSGAHAEIPSGTIFESGYPVEEFSRGDASQFALIDSGLFVLDTQNEYISFQRLTGGAPKSRSSVIEWQGDKYCIWGVAERNGTLLAVEARFTDEGARNYREVAVYEVPPQTGSGFEQKKLSALHWFDLCDEDERIESVVALSSALVAVSSKNRAIRFDPPDGRSAVIAEESCIDVLRMDDSCVVLVQEAEGCIQLSAYDLGRGEITASKSIPADSSGFAMKDGDVYYCDHYCLYKVALTGDSAPVAVKNLPVEGGKKALVSGNSYLIGVMNQVCAFDMNATTSGAVSIYYDMMDSSMLDSFARENPNLQLTIENARGRDCILTDLLTRNSAVDVYVLSTAASPAFKTVRNRGYATEIDSESVREYISRLYPQIQHEVVVDGKICGVPISMQVQICALGVNLKVWEALGMAREELPQSWEELMAFITERWPDMQESALDAGICLMYRGDFETLPTVFICNRKGQNPSVGEAVYATPDMINNYDRYQNALLRELYAPDDFRGSPLFTIFEMTPGMNMTPEYALLPLTLDGKACDPLVTMEIMVINPYSERRDAALKLIEHCIRNISPRNAIMMMPDNNAPVERSDYADQLLQLQETIAVWDAKIAAAPDEAERRNLEENKARAVQSETEFLESIHWEVSAADIQAYRNRMNNFCIMYSFTADEAEERKLSDLHAKFDSGKIDARTYAANLDQAITMSELENE